MKKTYLGEIIKTLLWRDLLIYALSVYIGTVMYNFFDSLVKHIILPGIKTLFPNYEIFESTNQEFNSNEFLSQSLNLIIASYLTYVSIKFVQRVET